MIEFKKISCIVPALGMVLSGCGPEQIEFDTDLHLTKEKVAEEQPVAPVSGVPDLISSTAALPELSYEGQGEVFDVVVDHVSVRQVLSSIADQAQLNIDIDPGVDGLISINAYGQNLGQLLERIRKQIPMRFERIGETLVVLPDARYVKQYHLNFPDLTRTYSSAADGTIPSSGSGSLGSSSVGSTKEGSGSVWQDLEEALTAVLEGLDVEREEFEPGPPGDSDDAAEQRAIFSVLSGRSTSRNELGFFVHTMPDAGLIILYGDSEQQKLAGDIIDKVRDTSRRQVLLQATVVEIALNSQYQQGIDWSVFNVGGDASLLQSASRSYGGILDLPTEALIALFVDEYEERRPENAEYLEEQINVAIERRNDLIGQLNDLPLNPAPGSADAIARADLNTAIDGAADVRDSRRAALDSYLSERDAAIAVYEETPIGAGSGANGGFFNATFSVGDLEAAVSLLDQFGDTRVVSSPRISTLNGQGAILKVVTDQIYFTTETTRERDESGVETTSVEVETETLPVGFVVNVYPQIGNDGTIILAMRPSVSRVVGFVNQPIVGDTISGAVPVVSIKEIDTLMMVNDGQTAVMGGLIEDQLQDSDTGIPGISKLPGVGNLFKNVDQRSRRVEYVIFVSAKIITNPSIYGDFREYQDLLPSDETFRRDETGSLFESSTVAVPRGQ